MNKIYVVYKYQDLTEDTFVYISEDKEKAEKVVGLEVDCYTYMVEYQNTETYTNQKDVTKLENKIKELEKECNRLNKFYMKQFGKNRETNGMPNFTCNVKIIKTAYIKVEDVKYNCKCGSELLQNDITCTNCKRPIDSEEWEWVVRDKAKFKEIR